MNIDLNEIIRDIAGSYDIAKRKEFEMFEERKEELLKQQQEQQHQADCDSECREVNFNDY